MVNWHGRHRAGMGCAGHWTSRAPATGLVPHRVVTARASPRRVANMFRSHRTDAATPSH